MQISWASYFWRQIRGKCQYNHDDDWKLLHDYHQNICCLCIIVVIISPFADKTLHLSETKRMGFHMRRWPSITLRCPNFPSFFTFYPFLDKRDQFTIFAAKSLMRNLLIIHNWHQLLQNIYICHHCYHHNQHNHYNHANNTKPAKLWRCDSSR